MVNACSPLSIDGEILNALELGNSKSALTLSMNKYGPAIYSYCKRMLADENIAEDALQMTFLDAYKDISKFHGDSSFKTWLFSIARHRCLDIIKANKVRDKYVLISENVPDVVDESSEPEYLSHSRDIHTVLTNCLDKLKPEIKSAILLKFMQGYTYTDMVAISGENAATLQARVTRALPELLRCLKIHGVSL